MRKPLGLVAIDVGGTKTLVAVFSYEGRIMYEQRFATPKKYPRFIKEITPFIDEVKDKYDIKGCCCALPSLIDHERGVSLVFGNLSWRDVPIRKDISKLLGGLAVYVENDAKLAGLSEAILKHNKYKNVLYLTISTGIGAGITINGKISADLINAEPGQMILEHEGELKRWEDIASGRALVTRFGKKASEQNDPQVWKVFARDVAMGLEHVIAIVQPDVVIIGGSVGEYFDKYGDFLKHELKKLENDMVKIPPVMKAERPTEAVIYGCYEYIKQNG